MSIQRQEKGKVGSQSTPVSHSKGPWEMGRDRHGYESHYRGPSIYSADRFMVAETLAGMDATDANALLIAAAPDLLAGAKAILAARDGKASIDAIIQLRDAIAKAEGRS